MTGQADQERSDKGSKRWIVIGLAAVVAGVAINMALSAVGAGPEGPAEIEQQAPLVDVVAVEAIGQEYEVVEDGFLRPQSRIDVVPEVSGKVVEVSPKLTLGGRFADGERLFRIDDRTYRAEIARATASLSRAEAQVAQARADFQRQENLSEIGATATARLEQSRASYASARAAVEEARAAVETAQKRLDDTDIVAPFRAQVQSEQVDIGAYVAPGNPVARLYSVGTAEVAVGLSPREADAVRRAAAAHDGPLQAEIRPTQASALSIPLIGHVAEIASFIDPQARTVDVLVRVEEAFVEANDGRVFSDDYVAVALPARSNEPLYRAPTGVVRKEAFVWILDEENRLARVNVTTVERTDDQVTFRAGEDLSGERLVLTALTEEAEGMAVRPVLREAQMAARATSSLP